MTGHSERPCRVGLSRLLAACRRLGRIWPVEAPYDSTVEDAYRFLGVEAHEGVVAGADAAGVLAGCATAVVLLVSVPALLPLCLVAGCLPPLVARYGAVLVARLVRSRAMGYLPALVMRLTLRLRVEPGLERAVEFAAETGDDQLSKSLGRHAERAVGTPESGLQSFAAFWGADDTTIERASALIVAADSDPPSARIRGCERAVEAVLDSLHAQAGGFANEIRGPLTGLYAFGVLLPLALVGVLPAASVAGFTVSPWHLVALYDVALPFGLATASCWLLGTRPVSLPAVRVGRDHPAVPDRRLRATLVGIVSGVAAGLVAQFLVAWSAPVVGLGVGVGTALLIWGAPAHEVRMQIRAAEAGIPEALTLVGRSVADGAGVERALATTASSLPSQTGEMLRRASDRTRTLGLTVDEAFLGDHGVCQTVTSPRLRETAVLFALAATEGEPAGDVLVTAGDHVRELRRVEQETRRSLASLTGTLANTAVLFGPLVGGVTVAMAGRLASENGTAASHLGGGVGASVGASTGAGAVSTAETLAASHHLFGLSIGLYVLVLAVELTVLSTALRDGFDLVEIAYRVGYALPLASGSYVVAVVLATQLL